MKKTYMVSTRKSDGTVVLKGILAEDYTSTPPVPAIIQAINAALANAGAGSEVVNINWGGTVDIDATAS